MSEFDLDPELRPLVEMMPSIELDDPVAVREMQRAMADVITATTDTSGLDVVDGELPGLEGDPDVAYRMYRRSSNDDEAMPAILLLHGGGFVVGSSIDEHERASTLARALDAVVVAIDYRLAPEHPYPAAFRDACAALGWLRSDRARLGVDPARLAVVGNSAGGALAAALALDDVGDDPPLRMQVLLNPVLDDRLGSASMQRFFDTPIWSRRLAERSWDLYLGERGPAPVEPTAAPARAVDVSGTPPAYITAMEFDPLRDEALEYAMRLMAAGVSVELHCFAGAVHGAAGVPVTALGRRARDELVEVLRRRLAAG